MRSSTITRSRININRLRKKLAQLDVPEEFLQTRRSLGYVIE